MMVNGISPAFRGTLSRDEPMSRHTSWRLGGPAKYYYVPADRDDLVVFLKTIPEDETVIFLGLGSNILVRDGGINGVVIILQGTLDALHLLDENTVYAEAGVTCAKLARFIAKQHLGAGEFFAGIPGTVGGALAMNAGAFGGETWNYIIKVETVDRKSVIRERDAAEFRASYRTVIKPADEWFLAAHFRFLTNTEKNGLQIIKDLLAKRSQTQPIGIHSCGSVFRNPEGDYAARLIESAGLKGFSIGGAQVSERHANFMVNDGTATSQDMEKLIQHVQAVVKRTFNIELQTEVKIIGENLK